MIDRPEGAVLLGAMAATLSEEVVPATSGPAQHAARVVANLCRILEREWNAGAAGAEATRTEIAALLAREGSLEELVEALDQALRNRDAVLDERGHAILRADVKRRLAVDRPGYDAFVKKTHE